MITFMDFSNQYKNFYEELLKDGIACERLDLSDVSGTNAYCDSFAEAEIRKRIENKSTSGVRFLDSGNYHYLSLFWLEKIDRDFALILFDNHTDMQEPEFEGILSCGSWAKVAQENLQHLKEIYLCGMEKDGMDSYEINTKLPIYISIDKDVLSSEFAACDWDQGQMSLDELLSRIEIFKGHEIIGIDICGDKKSSPTSKEITINHKTNKSLMALISDYFSFLM